MKHMDTKASVKGVFYAPTKNTVRQPRDIKTRREFTQSNARGHEHRSDIYRKSGQPSQGGGRGSRNQGLVKKEVGTLLGGGVGKSQMLAPCRETEGSREPGAGGVISFRPDQMGVFVSVITLKTWTR